MRKILSTSLKALILAVRREESAREYVRAQELRGEAEPAARVLSITLSNGNHYENIFF
ncbi:MAG: hypothetical protein ABSA46_17560 [Thermodesulfovibrionales bacterium]